MTRIGWFHCAAGASGDMLLGALVDAGAPVEVLVEAIRALPVERMELSVEAVTRHGIGATKVSVHAPRTTVARTWPAVRQLLVDAALAEPVRATALDVFERLANAEATVHRTTPEHVHFHEVGALDALADVVGAAAGLHALGLDVVTASSVATGNGMTRSEHGLLPVPTPAVLELLRGAPVHSGAAQMEMCTPTGAAVLASVVSQWGDLPPMVVERVGLGAGERDPDEVPNLLRLVIGTAPEQTRGARQAGAADEALLLAANVDDLDPRVWPAVLDALLGAGASDAWLTPIHMKKGRPAVTVSVLCAPTDAPTLRRLLFHETSTIGVRESMVAKHTLARELVPVTLADGTEVAVKLARLEGRVVNAVPEYDDVATAAAASGRPVKVVLAEASALAAALLDAAPAAADVEGDPA